MIQLNKSVKNISIILLKSIIKYFIIIVIYIIIIINSISINISIISNGINILYNNCTITIQIFMVVLSLLSNIKPH